MAHLKWYLDLPSPVQFKINNVVKVGPPLANFSGSEHGGFQSYIVT